MMGGSEFEDRQDREHLEWVASKLGLDPDDLAQQDWRTVENGGNDGAIYGYRVEFGDGSDPEVLAKIDGLQDGYWINIGFPPEEPDEPE